MTEKCRGVVSDLQRIAGTFPKPERDDITDEHLEAYDKEGQRLPPAPLIFKFQGRKIAIPLISSAESRAAPIRCCLFSNMENTKAEKCQLET